MTRRVVERVQFDFAVPSRESAVVVQDLLSEFRQRWLSTIVDESLEEVIGTEASLQTERLRVDLGTFTLDELQQALPDRLRHALVRALRDHAPGTLEGAGAPAGAGNHSTGARLHSSSPPLDSSLTTFVQTGRATWELQGASVDLDDRLDREFLLHSAPAELASALTTHATARLRLARQFSRESLRRTYGALQIDRPTLEQHRRRDTTIGEPANEQHTVAALSTLMLALSMTSPTRSGTWKRGRLDRLVRRVMDAPDGDPHAIAELLTSTPAARERLSRLCKPSTLQRIFGALPPGQAKNIIAAYDHDETVETTATTLAADPIMIAAWQRARLVSFVCHDGVDDGRPLHNADLLLQQVFRASGNAAASMARTMTATARRRRRLLQYFSRESLLVVFSALAPEIRSNASTESVSDGAPVAQDAGASFRTWLLAAAERSNGRNRRARSAVRHLARISSEESVRSALHGASRDGWIAQLRATDRPHAASAALVRILPWRALERMLQCLAPTQASFAISVLRMVDTAGTKDVNVSCAAAWCAAISFALETGADDGSAREWMRLLLHAAGRDGGQNTESVTAAVMREAEQRSTRFPRYGTVAEIGAAMSSARDDMTCRRAPELDVPKNVMPPEAHPAHGLLAPTRYGSRASTLAGRADTLDAPAIETLLATLQYGRTHNRRDRRATLETRDRRVTPADNETPSRQAPEQEMRRAPWAQTAAVILADPLLRSRLLATQRPAVIVNVVSAATAERAQLVPGPSAAANTTHLLRAVSFVLALLTVGEDRWIGLSHAAQQRALRRARRTVMRYFAEDAARHSTAGDVSVDPLRRLVVVVMRRAARARGTTPRQLLTAARAQWSMTVQSGVSATLRDRLAVTIDTLLDTRMTDKPVPVRARAGVHPAAANRIAPMSIPGATGATKFVAPAFEAVQVDDAGTVLLWPFFSHLFTTLGLVSNGQFVTSAAAERGVLLLRLLTTGEAAAPEPALALGRLLCGLRDETPLPRTIDVSDAERDLCASLLAVACQRWSPLATTTADGLRESFLVREGRLSQRDDGWVLSVAPRAYDMLLDQLPWMLTPVRLPWMPALLHVRWRE